jgi:uncharacterized protein YkwD
MQWIPLVVLIVCVVGLALVPALAPASSVRPAPTCPGQNDDAGPAAIQERAMRCLVNRARRNRGLGAIHRSIALDRAAAHKSADILRCDSFSHEACGREFTYWMRHFGYLQGGCWQAAENIAWGSGGLGSARSIFRAWMRSPGHRANILGPYTDIGIGLEIGELEGHVGAHVWTEEFGSRAC